MGEISAHLEVIIGRGGGVKIRQKHVTDIEQGNGRSELNQNFNYILSSSRATIFGVYYSVTSPVP